MAGGGITSSQGKRQLTLHCRRCRTSPELTAGDRFGVSVNGGLLENWNLPAAGTSPALTSL